jgi:hypothetical protein
MIRKNIKIINGTMCDILIVSYIVSCLNQVKYIYCFKHLSFIYVKNFYNPFF